MIEIKSIKIEKCEKSEIHYYLNIEINESPNDNWKNIFLKFYNKESGDFPENVKVTIENNILKSNGFLSFTLIQKLYIPCIKNSILYANNPSDFIKNMEIRINKKI